MFSNLMKTLIMKALYAFAAVLIAWLVQSIGNFHPEPGLQSEIWKWLLLPALTGLIALLKRLLTWDPKKL